jgi:hypothetical protein
LKLWQEEFGGPDEQVRRAFADHPVYGSDVVSNRLSAVGKSVKSDEFDYGNEHNEEDGEDDFDDHLPTVALFLKPGDVVEIA